MMKFLMLVSLLLGAQAALASSSRDAAAVRSASTYEASLPVEQLISRNLAARGGEQAWRHVDTMTMSGVMDAGKEMQVPYTIDLKRGRKSRVEIVFDSQTAVQVYDGAKGWKRRPYLGHSDVEPFTAEELQRAALSADLDGPLADHVARGTKVEMDGSDLIEGKSAYRLKLTLKTGQVRHLWLDKSSSLEVQIDGIRRLDGKERAIATHYRDYRLVNGLLVPFLFETSVMNQKTSEKIVIDKVVINPPLSDARFTNLL